MGAHPRSRGENRLRNGHHGWHGGSSPLTRGKLVVVICTHAPLGLIPAHAGKTRGPHTANRTAGAHPRSRGENLGPGGEDVLARGSSPLTRGKPPHGAPPGTSVGLIPAHAGKTFSPWSTFYVSKAHPRSRGENGSVHRLRRRQEGSSPLTRGKRELCGADAERCGLIPAHAGKTAWLVDVELTAGAHPRSRGENTPSRPASGSCTGSSPLTRGKPLRVRPARKLEGLIPAHAGKTASSTPRSTP